MASINLLMRRLRMNTKKSKRMLRNNKNLEKHKETTFLKPPPKKNTYSSEIYLNFFLGHLSQLSLGCPSPRSFFTEAAVTLIFKGFYISRSTNPISITTLPGKILRKFRQKKIANNFKEILLFNRNYWL